ncbi:unnamed protein product [Heterobilharzia americana]|nr:unnamed protein product [Heterobilharzia americana]
MKKGIAFPTAISLNNIICHYAPIESEENDPTEVKNGDLVKINVGAHIDGYAAIAGHTLVVGASQDNKVTGRKADVIIAAHTAAEAVLRSLRPSIENSRASEIVGKATVDFNCHPVEGTQCHQMKRMIYDAEKSIIFSPTDEQKKTVEKCTFDTNDVWNIDIMVSTEIYSEIANKFLAYPFNIRALDDIRKARLGITECVKHDVIQPLSVYCEKDDELVAQFRYTVLLMPNGPMKVTGLPFDPSLYKSELKVKDQDIRELLAQPVKIQSKKRSQNQNLGRKHGIMNPVCNTDLSFAIKAVVKSNSFSGSIKHMAFK